MRKFLITATFCAALLASPATTHAQALPHGCVSASSDYSVDADTFRRTVGTRVHKDEPCTFVFAAGDTYTGSGRFSVACSTGGYFFHPDYRDDREVQPDVNLPIPQPCADGATVTVDGYHAGSGGAVAGGGLGALSAPNTNVSTDPVLSLLGLRSPTADFEALCDRDSKPVAEVSLVAQENKGLLTFGGTVDCRGAAVDITTVKITGIGGYPAPAYAGTAACRKCRAPISVSGTAPTRPMQYDVEMYFDVSRPNKPTVQGYRLGRYVTNWNNHVTTLYPVPGDNAQPCVSDCAS